MRTGVVRLFHGCEEDVPQLWKSRATAVRHYELLAKLRRRAGSQAKKCRQTVLNAPCYYCSLFLLHFNK